MGKRTLAILAAGLGLSSTASALEFNFGDVSVGWTNRVTLGAGWRVEDRDPALIGKLNNNPLLCAGDDCMTFGGDPEPNQRLVDAPGGYFANKMDDGNMNYDQGDMYSGLAKLTTSVSANWQDFTLKVSAIGFFDAINKDLDQTHFNNCQVFDTCDYFESENPTYPSNGAGGYQPLNTVRDDGINDVYGAEIRLRDYAVGYSTFLGDRIVSLRVGAQNVTWGESNLVFINSINQINPADVRALRLPGGQINEIFQPVPMVTLSGDLFPDQGVTAEAFYQLKWMPAIADAGGTLYGALDPLYRDGTNAYASIDLGQFPEDPLVYDPNDERFRGRHRIQNTLAPLLTDTSLVANVYDSANNGGTLRDPMGNRIGAPQDDGQFGVKIGWFADMINNGTEFGIYAMNIHSRLPFLSFNSTDRTPLRDLREGAGSLESLLFVLGNCEAVGGDCFPVDTASVVVDYPDNIRLFGVSFNTNIGSWSVAGEYSYQPNVPVQVSMADVFMAALQPGLPADEIVLDANILGLPDNILTDLLNGLGSVVTDPLLGSALPITVPGARTAVPDYIETVHRGNDNLDQIYADRCPDTNGDGVGDPCNYFIPGYERLKVGQLVLNGIRIFGNSDAPASWIGAEQLIFLIEGGVTQIMNMPNLNQFQLDGLDPNQTHYSCGADGTGASEGYDPVNFPRCNGNGNGPDGVRNTSSLNPTFQTDGYGTEFSGGLRTLIQAEYNDVIFGINFKPTIIGFIDVFGRSPFSIFGFMEGRTELMIGTEWYLGQKLSGRILYDFHAGDSSYLYRDKDSFSLDVSYSF